MNFFIKDLIDVNVNDLAKCGSTIVGLDIGDKTIGIAVSDRRIKIATALSVINRKSIKYDYASFIDITKTYNPGLIIFGWPVQMNGIPSTQCEKVLEFVEGLSEYINSEDRKVDSNFEKDPSRSIISFAKWDERFSTSVVESLMITADVSRKRRKQLIDKTAAVYILQGAIDFLNKPKSFSENLID